MSLRDYWYKDAIIYELDVETYADSDGDGIGDFEGLINKLPYLEALGINCLWLLPFYPSPNRDNGYDVTDYYGVDRRLGDGGQFVEFIQRAHDRGIRVIGDLVVNHTSDQHPWFQEAREGPESKLYDYYVWSKEKPEDADEGMVFPGVQETTWTYDRKAKAYYFHRFYEHQPELNIANPEVRGAINRVMGYWLKLGISGFRVDAAPFLIELKGIEHPDMPDPYSYLGDMRDFLSWRKGDAILLAEANVAMDKVAEYFRGGDRLHMLFNFMVNQHLFLALARGSAEPLIEGFEKIPPIPPSGQWANFLRNHDELDLGRLTESQRQEAFEVFAPQEDMRLYGRGIRRRLPPMMKGDQRWLRMAYSLMFALPGTPVIRYGQEIGMGDDLSLPERSSVRTPMQWDSSRNAGFSSAEAGELIRPVISTGAFGYEKVNVAAQQNDTGSMLQWMQRMIRIRKECPEIGRGDYRILETHHPAVFGMLYKWQGQAVVTLHNLADETAKARPELEGYDLAAGTLLASDEGGEEEISRPPIEIDSHGYRWYRISEPE